MAKKFDGVIEAVRYNPNGEIALVRGYELRGVAYSDRILLDRAALLERLKEGKKFSTGQRVEFWGGTFDLGKPVRVVSQDGKDFVTTCDNASKRDEIEETPAF
jgi:hypothetical protein